LRPVAEIESAGTPPGRESDAIAYPVARRFAPHRPATRWRPVGDERPRQDSMLLPTAHHGAGGIRACSRCV